MRCGQYFDIAGIWAAEQIGVMDALACGGEKRAFHVNAQNARNLLLDRLIDRRQRGMHLLGGIGDQRGQHPRGAVFAMCFGDAAQRFYRRRVVEQQAAAAVHLHIDKAGQQQAPLQIVSFGVGNACIVVRNNGDNAFCRARARRRHHADRDPRVRGH